MARTQDIKTVNIRPGVTILSVLRHLNYKPWFALAEFVDNSIQSFLSNRARLLAAEGEGFRLRVDIELDLTSEPRLIIRDNASGISSADYPRAFRPAEVPADRSGLSEFGIGMKSAACWFAPRWVVRTKALGETVERTVRFDIESIVHDKLDELAIISGHSPEGEHFTEVALEGLHKPPQIRTVGKIKEYLADIYRQFTRDGTLDLRFNGEPLRYDEPPILRAPFYKDRDGKRILWKKPIDFDLGLGLKVTGFAAIREKASTSRAGFALFRRGRLIEGAGEEGYRPEEIFGKSNSYRYQRVFGELHLEGFEVSHTKDGFRWDDNESTFLKLLKDELDNPKLPLLQQADRLRVRVKKGDLRAGAREAAARTAAAISAVGSDSLSSLAHRNGQVETIPGRLPKATIAAHEVVREVEFRGERWVITIELTDDRSIADWLSINEREDTTARRLGLRLSIVHPFMEQYGGTTVEEIEPLLRIAVALGLSETVARLTGVSKAGRVRHNLNELLRGALCQP